MITIGITGRSGVGKSTVAKAFAEKGIPVADADKIARDVLEKNSPCLPKLQKIFGDDIYQNEILDRKLLANRAFATKEGTKQLTDITHPEIYKRIKAFIDENKKAEVKLCAIDGAVIIGSICEELCEQFLIITAPMALSVERIMARDNITEEMAIRRLNAQVTEDELLVKANYHIVADSDNETLRLKVFDLIKIIKGG